MTKTNKTVYFAVFALAVAFFVALAADIEGASEHPTELRVSANLIA